MTHYSDLRKNRFDQESFAAFNNGVKSLKLRLRDIGLRANSSLNCLEDDDAEVETGGIWEMFGRIEQLSELVQDIFFDPCGGKKCGYVCNLLTFCESTIEDLSIMMRTVLKDCGDYLM